MTTAQMAGARATAPTQEVHRVWTREEVIAGFQELSGEPVETVTYFVDSLVEMAKEMIAKGQPATLPSTAWLKTCHATMVAGIPARVNSQPNTPHRGIEELVTPPTEGITRIHHDIVAIGEVKHCAVVVSYETVKV
jgi:hypothetical protein